MKSEIEHTSTMLGSQNMKSSQRMVSVVEPYELPEGWKWETLEKLCFIPITDGTHQTPTYSDSDSGIPFISSKDVTKEFIDWSNIKYITKELHSELYKRVSPQIDDILLAKNGTTGVAAIVDTDKIFDIYVTLALIRPNKEIILPRFLLQVINSPICKNQFDEHLTGIGVPNLHLRDIRTTMIPLPSTLDEQQRIVNRIESMFAKLDEAKEKAQNVVDGFETRKAAILHKAFTGELKIENEKLNEEDWEETTLSECCKLGSGGTPSKSHPEYYENGDIPWLKTGEIDWNDIYDVEEKITNAGVENSSAKIFPAESVVVAMYGMGVTRGKAAIIKIPTTTNQAVCVLQPNKKLNNRFLFYYFMCNYWQIREQSVGGNQLNLSGKIIASFPIKLPPLNYQLSIVNFLDSVLEKETRAKEAAQTVLDQIALLKKSILARAFRGEL